MLMANTHPDLKNITKFTININFIKNYFLHYFLITEILQYNSTNTSIPSTEASAFPGNKEHLKTGHFRTMLKRYFFAADYFCKGKNVLDSCCGLGWGAYILSKFARNVNAFDSSSEIIKFCKKTWNRQNIHWQTADAMDMSTIENEYFDVVIAMESIEHFNYSDGEKYIGNLNNKLKTHGFLIGTSLFKSTREEADAHCKTNPHHLYIYTLDEISALLKKYFKDYAIISNWMFIGFK